MMQRIFLLLLFSLVYSPILLAETSSKGFVFFPVTDSSFEMKPSLSKISGAVTIPEGNLDSTTVGKMDLQGVELQLDCPWFQFGANPLRQQISYSTYTQEGFDMSSFEINPNYIMTTDSRLIGLGFGPGFGGLRHKNKTTGETETFMTLQFSASLSLNLGFLHLGLEQRKQRSQVEGQKYWDNNRKIFKVGINF
ncbi:MAG: hypothetical protein QNL04_12380 [SAR324 cluster bacterium]|nr:hypothetical protein [SAR324 cluster bacterium]